MKYIKVEWPEIQDYMMREDYNKRSYFDPMKNCWFVPAVWEEEQYNENYEEESWGDIGDLEDAMG